MTGLHLIKGNGFLASLEINVARTPCPSSKARRLFPVYQRNVVIASEASNLVFYVIASEASNLVFYVIASKASNHEFYVIASKASNHEFYFSSPSFVRVN